MDFELEIFLTDIDEAYKILKKQGNRDTSAIEILNESMIDRLMSKKIKTLLLKFL